MVNKWITFDLDGTIMQNPFIAHVFPEIQKGIYEKNRELANCVDAFVAEHQNRIRQSKFVEAYDWGDIINSFTHVHQLNWMIDVEALVKKHCVPGSIYLLEEDIIEVLQSLKLRGYSLAVITNGYSNFQLPVMDALALTPYFDKIIAPDTTGFAKPDINVFMELEEVVAHIGDRIDHDIIPANTWGTKAIWINRSLPDNLKCIKPELRGVDQGMSDLLFTKLKKEGHDDLSTVPMEAIPTHIIYKFNELLNILA